MVYCSILWGFNPGNPSTHLSWVQLGPTVEGSVWGSGYSMVEVSKEVKGMLSAIESGPTFGELC